MMAEKETGPDLGVGTASEKASGGWAAPEEDLR
jgi:hypothetical protein